MTSLRLEILRFLTEGHSKAEVAALLALPDGEVETDLRNISAEIRDPSPEDLDHTTGSDQSLCPMCRSFFGMTAPWRYCGAASTAVRYTSSQSRPPGLTRSR